MDSALAHLVLERMHAALDHDLTLARAVRAGIEWPHPPIAMSDVCRFASATGVAPELLLASVEGDLGRLAAVIADDEAALGNSEV